MATEIQSTTQKISAMQLDSDLLEELQCQVCLQYMASSIKMCENGHNFCGGCREGLSECLTCRGHLTNVRNIVLEKFAAKAKYPCKNVRNGCEETFTLDDKDNHLAVCLFQSRECPFRNLSGVDCSWTGILSDVAGHITREHDSELAEVPPHFRVVLLDFVNLERNYRIAVICLGELFYLTWKTQNNVLRFRVFHVGPKNESNDFKYGIKIGNSDGYVAVTRKCHNYLDGGLKDMEPWNRVTLGFGSTQEGFGEEGEFSCEIEIGKWKLEGFVSEDKLECMPVIYPVRNS